MLAERLHHVTIPVRIGEKELGRSSGEGEHRPTVDFLPGVRATDGGRIRDGDLGETVHFEATEGSSLVGVHVGLHDGIHQPASWSVLQNEYGT